MLTTSTLSWAVNALRTHLHHAEGRRLQNVRIQVGHPGRFGRDGVNHETLNIFVYRVDSSGSPAFTSNTEPRFLTLHCLFTPMTKGDDAQGVGAGDMELRLLGHTLEILHKHPLVTVRDDDGRVLTKLQVVPSEIGIEELNRIFSTQFETSYRVSAAYELARVPIFFAPPHDAPRVTAVDLGISSDVEDQQRDPSDANASFKFHVQAGFKINTNRPDWQPHLALVNPEGHTTYALQLEKTPGEPLPPLRVLGFGDGNGSLRIQRRVGSGMWEQPEDRGSLHLEQYSIDPRSNYSDAATMSLPLEGECAILDEPGQVWIWAERTWHPANRPEVIIRSNALCITLLGGDR